MQINAFQERCDQLYGRAGSTGTTGEGVVAAAGEAAGVGGGSAPGVGAGERTADPLGFEARGAEPGVAGAEVAGTVGAAAAAVPEWETRVHAAFSKAAANSFVSEGKDKPEGEGERGVGPGRGNPPRRQSHFDAPFIELCGIL